MRIDLLVLTTASLLGICALTAAVASELMPSNAKPPGKASSTQVATAPKAAAINPQAVARTETAHGAIGTFVPLSAPPVIEPPKPKIWNAACSKEKCIGAAEIALPEGAGKVQMWITRSGESIAVGALVPLGFHIPTGVGISTDDGRSIVTQLKFVDCSKDGCRAIGELSNTTREKMEAAENVMMTLKDAKTQGAVGLRMPMSGFAQSVAMIGRAN
jgi:invasion protein IalB